VLRQRLPGGLPECQQPHHAAATEHAQCNTTESLVAGVSLVFIIELEILEFVQVFFRIQRLRQFAVVIQRCGKRLVRTAAGRHRFTR
jgi:hypothetical protein